MLVGKPEKGVEVQRCQTGFPDLLLWWLKETRKEIFLNTAVFTGSMHATQSGTFSHYFHLFFLLNTSLGMVNIAEEGRGAVALVTANTVPNKQYSKVQEKFLK